MLVNSQLTTPRCQSNSQIHTVMAATTGMAQASSIATCSTYRVTLPTAFISRATPTPRTTVIAAFTKQKAIERPTTAQVCASEKSAM